jgi:hypothetical protein
MNKKYIYFGLGLLAVGGLAYYFMSGRSSDGAKSASSDSSSSDAPLTDGANSTPPAETASSSLDSTLGGRVSAGSGRREIRRNCRQEARDRGLRGRAKRQFRRDCRRSGGFDDGADEFLGASGSLGGCTTANGYVGRWEMIPQGTYPETYIRTCVSRGFRDRA